MGLHVDVGRCLVREIFYRGSTVAQQQTHGAYTGKGPESDGRENPTIWDPDSAALPPAWWDFLSGFPPLDPPSSVKRPGAAHGATTDGLRHGKG